MVEVVFDMRNMINSSSRVNLCIVDVLFDMRNVINSCLALWCVPPAMVRPISDGAAGSYGSWGLEGVNSPWKSSLSLYTLPNISRNLMAHSHPLDHVNQKMPRFTNSSRICSTTSWKIGNYMKRLLLRIVKWEGRFIVGWTTAALLPVAAMHIYMLIIQEEKGPRDVSINGYVWNHLTIIFHSWGLLISG